MKEKEKNGYANTRQNKELCQQWKDFFLLAFPKVSFTFVRATWHLTVTEESSGMLNKSAFKHSTWK